MDLSFFGDAIINVVLGAKSEGRRISVGSISSQTYVLTKSSSIFTPIHDIQGVGLSLGSET